MECRVIFYKLNRKKITIAQRISDTKEKEIDVAQRMSDAKEKIIDYEIFIRDTFGMTAK